MAQYAKLPDGNYAKFPDDWTPQKIDSTLRADHPDLFKGVKPLSDQHLNTSLLDKAEDVGKNVVAGAVRGAARIGTTILTPVDSLYDKVTGNDQQNLSSLISGQKPQSTHEWRQQQLDQFMGEHADPSSIAYKGGDIAAQVAGTAGIGGVLGKGVEAISQAPKALELAEALKTSGMAGGGLATRVAGGAASGAAQTAMVNPKGAAAGGAVGGALPLVGKAIPALGALTADLIGSLGTHTGGEGLKIAARAGAAGGKRAQTFADNMRGNVPIQDVLDKAKQNIAAMVAAKSAEYRQGMASVSGDKTVLNFNGIDKSLSNAASTVSYKGQIKNVKAAQIQQKIAEEIDHWKSLDPAEFHTPEGLDALKQKIGGIVEGIPYEEKTARMVGKNIYNSIKDEITKQAPAYSKVMKNYQGASEQIKEVERALSIGNKSSADTAIRKLQSLLRNNVNTNYGNRVKLVKTLEEKGGVDMMSSLAGQSLSSIIPRGLGGVVASATGMGGLYMHNPSVIPLLALQSPRLMGEAALGAGKVANNPYLLESIAKSAPIVAGQK